MKNTCWLRPEFLATALAAGLAGPSLAESWAHAPLERWSAPAFAVWAVPVCRELVQRGTGVVIPLIWTSLLLLAAGAALDFHILSHAALACVLAAFVPWSRAAAVWLTLAVSWMPAAGWLGAGWLTGPVAALRFAICAVAAAAVLWTRRISAPETT